jgi:hypothetical protein
MPFQRVSCIGSEQHQRHQAREEPEAVQPVLAVCEPGGQDEWRRPAVARVERDQIVADAGKRGKRRAYQDGHGSDCRLRGEEAPDMPGCKRLHRVAGAVHLE